jgi:anaerobic selenocysteine-containing dehydrogenase
VQVSTKLNRAHLVTGRQALILPCLGRSEIDLQAGGPQFVSCENSMGVIQSSQGNLPPASPELLSEPAIVARLAKATLGDCPFLPSPSGRGVGGEGGSQPIGNGKNGTVPSSPLLPGEGLGVRADRMKVPWLALVENYDRIRDLIEQVLPGFERYNERVRKPGGFYLPNEPRHGNFPTKIGKARFTVHRLPEIRLEPGQLLMTTIRSHDQFNTTVYGLDDRYRGIHNGRRVVFMNADDIREQGLAAGQAVDLTSYFQGQTRCARRFFVVPYNIPRRCAATYFPETNVLVPIGSVAETSNTPTSKSIVIRVTPCAAG